MKRFSALLFIFIFLSLFVLDKTFAVEFSQAFVRLNSNKPNSTLSGTVCATPSSAGAGVENNIQLTFHSDITLNSNPSSFTVNTSNLPNGSTAWPGIGSTATAITNKTVSLTSSDLNNGSALYCFNFTATGSSTGSTGEKAGNIATRNSSNSTIDSSDFGLDIVSNDQITVSATVPGSPNDYTIAFNKLTDGSTFSPGNTLDYEITYGSLESYNFPIVIETSWTQGTLIGDPVPSIDLLSYVSGSATNAYGSTIPVIDTENRKITWSISSFPGNTANQKIRFKLKIDDNYSASVKAAFTVNARLLVGQSSTTYKNLTNDVRPKSTTVTPTPTPTPTGDQTTGTITDVSLNTISSNSSTINIETTSISDATIYYGTNTSSLNNSKTSRNSNFHDLTLDDLEENTIYYFRIVIKDSNGTFTSDTYTFKTAKTSTPLLVDANTLVASSNDTIISSLTSTEDNTLILPVNSEFSFKFAMEDRVSAKNIQGLLRDDDVLGSFDFPRKAQAAAQSVNLIETLSGIYSGALKTYPTPGNYSLIARVSDKNGNITEQILASLKVIPKFTVISKNDKTPIEGARIFFYVYSPSSKTYHLIPASSIKGGNPLFTDTNGQLDLVLPQGKYRAVVSDLRHKEKKVDFEIGPRKNQVMPTVNLESSGLTPIKLYNYYSKSANDVLIKATKQYSEVLTGSTRFFDLVALATLAGFVFLTLYAFSKRHKIPITHMPSYFYYLLDRRDRGEKYIHGVVYDEKDNPVQYANVYLMDQEDEKIISHKKTNKQGEFIFKNGKREYLIMAMAKHHKASPVFKYQHKSHLKFKINLEKEEEGLDFFERLSHLVGFIAGMSFEVLLLGSFIFEILFLQTFGVLKTLPFLVISFLNLLIWILHLYNKSHK